MVPEGEGYSLRFGVTGQLDQERWGFAKQYITAYARANGWVLQGLRKKGRVVACHARPRKPSVARVQRLVQEDKESADKLGGVQLESESTGAEVPAR